MIRIHIDFETYSEIDLRLVGLHAYAEHPSTEILCCAFATGHDPVQLWIPGVDYMRRAMIQAGVPGVMIHWDECPIPRPSAQTHQYAAWNAEFERTIGNSHVGQSIGFPATLAKDWVCTAAKAAVSGLPRSLGDACSALETDHQKSEDGRGVMMQLARPRKGRLGPRWTVARDTEKYLQLYRYCVDDVRAERSMDDELPDLTKNERRVYLLDQDINDRGIRIDAPAVENALYLIDEYKDLLDRKSVKITGLRLTQTEKLATWVRANGFPQLLDLQAPTIRDVLKGSYGIVPAKVKEVLQLRTAHAMKATSKLEKMLVSKSGDDRLRSMFLYHGAGTGRWAGQLVQLQNIFRGLISDPDVAISLYAHRALDLIQIIFEQAPMVVFASTIRGMLVPSEGRQFIVSDYKSIEARVLAWLAGQEDVLEVFRSHGLLYEHTAAKTHFPDRVNDIGFLREMSKTHPELRFQGKIATLALGFQGAVGALSRMTRKFGVEEMSDEEALDIVVPWRRENRKIVQMWSNLRDYAIHAVQNPGKVYKVNQISFRSLGQHLHLRLPSGRRIAYFRPLIMDGERGEELTYMGVDSQTHQWKRQRTYGGKLTENCVQATARDVLTNGMINLDNAGYTIVGHVHDEVICDEAIGHGSVEECSKLMCRLPKWADGLPTEADGWAGNRYRKD